MRVEEKRKIFLGVVVFFFFKGLMATSVSDSSKSTELYVKSNMFFFDRIETSTKTNIRTDLNLFWGSNVLDNNFFGTVFNSGKISKDQKDRALRRFKNKGVVGGGLKFSASYYQGLGKDSVQKAKGLGIFFSFQETQQFDCTFGKALYSLVFYGNSGFKGENLRFGNMMANYNRFQTLKIGITKKNKNIVFGMSGGIVRGMGNTSIKMNRGELYTAADPKKLKLNLDMDIRRTDTSGTVSYFNGQGLSTDLFLEWDITPKLSLLVTAQDLGFIHWAARSMRAKIEERAFEFTGISITRLSDLAGSEILYEYEDSLINSYKLNYTESSYSTLIPGRFELAGRINLNNLRLAAGLYKYLTRGYSFHYFMGLDHAIGGFFWQMNLGYGGYANLSAGLGLGMVLGKQLGVKLSSNNLLAEIQPYQSSENFYEVILKYQFN